MRAPSPPEQSGGLGTANAVEVEDSCTQLEGRSQQRSWRAGRKPRHTYGYPPPAANNESRRHGSGGKRHDALKEVLPRTSQVFRISGSSGDVESPPRARLGRYPRASVGRAPNGSLDARLIRATIDDPSDRVSRADRRLLIDIRDQPPCTLPWNEAAASTRVVHFALTSA